MVLHCENVYCLFVFFRRFYNFWPRLHHKSNARNEKVSALRNDDLNLPLRSEIGFRRIGEAFGRDGKHGL